MGHADEPQRIFIVTWNRTGMETNVNYTIVGLFVIALLTAIVLGIIWLSSGFVWEEYHVYKVDMEESVSGITVNSVVEYNGVEVGYVKGIKINKLYPRLVEILLNVKRTTPITQGTRAKLEMRSITGNAFIGLVDNGADMRPLTVLRGQKYPIIKTIPSIYVKLNTILTEANENIKVMSHSFAQISNSFSKISSSFQALLNKQNLNSIKQILKNVDNASHKFNPLLQSGQSSMRMIETQTLPVANQAIVNLDSITSNLSDLSTVVKQDPAVILRGKEQPALGPGE